MIFYQFNPLTNTFTKKADNPGVAAALGLVCAHGELVYFAGGANYTDALVNFYSYNPANNTWTTLAPLPGTINDERGSLKYHNGKLSMIALVIHSFYSEVVRNCGLPITIDLLLTNRL